MVETTVKACFYCASRTMHVIPLAVIFHGADYEGRSN